MYVKCFMVLLMIQKIIGELLWRTWLCDTTPIKADHTTTFIHITGYDAFLVVGATWKQISTFLSAHHVCKGRRLSSKPRPMVERSCSQRQELIRWIRRVWHCSRLHTASCSSCSRVCVHTHKQTTPFTHQN